MRTLLRLLSLNCHGVLVDEKVRPVPWTKISDNALDDITEHQSLPAASETPRWMCFPRGPGAMA